MTTPAPKAAPAGVTYTAHESGMWMAQFADWAMLVDGPVEVDGEAV